MLCFNEHLLEIYKYYNIRTFIDDTNLMDEGMVRKFVAMNLCLLQSKFLLLLLNNVQKAMVALI